VPHPGLPGRGEVLLRVTATGVCGSDLHSYQDGRIGDSVVKSPLILGHEFAGVVEAVGPDSLDGNFEPLRVGTRVAVDPAQPCGRCEMCERGDPNLCRRLHFCGNYPDNGSLCQWMHMPARSCFPVPDSIDDECAALLEPLGVAMHAVDLAKLRVANSVSILGAGPIGLLILQVAKLAGANPIFVSDPLPWRVKLAEEFGAIPFGRTHGACAEPRSIASERTPRPRSRRGGTALHNVEVDVVIEAAWGGDAIDQAIELTRPGGRVVLVGIPSEDRCAFKHSTARRKGLTVIFSRRMKHVYRRAIRLVEEGRVDLQSLITHRFPLEKAAEAFELNAEYKDNVVKVIVEH
jgi:L-iditol 2-dehydrogenase